jgi:glycosyltransferase involved in cell wall biosynthesis
MAAPRWSVVVPARGPCPDLEKLLTALARQTYSCGDFELVVVDDGSPDPVRLPAGAPFPAKLIRQRGSGPGPARNRGIAEAQGEWVAFTGADCEPAPNWLASLESASRRWPAAGLGGAVRCGLPESAPAMTSHLVVKHLERQLNRVPEDAQFFTPNNLAVPLAEFRAFGGFGASYSIGTGEDRDFCARWRNGGRRLVAVPEAVVTHTHPLTLMGLLRQQYRYGRGSGIHRRTQRSLGSPVRFEGPGFYLGSLRAPWREEPGCRAPWTVAALMGASQVLNALGVIRESVRRGGRQ